MPETKSREHATRDDDTGRTMCGRDASAVRVNDGMPTCRRCLRAIARAIARRERLAA